MKITIHRGIAQIGGCITSIESKSGTKVLIDLGHNLPDGDNSSFDPLDKKENLDDILKGVSHIFYSHYHGDHLGFESKVPANIKQHMGQLAIDMVNVLKKHMTYAAGLKDEAEASLIALSQFEAFQPYEKKSYGDIDITPIPISHSALDAYMFLIECDKHYILHTGDFRDHGYNAEEKLIELENHLPHNIEILISEGTMLGRGDTRVMSEQTLQEEAVKILDKKYTFVLCSSMDIDRIVSFSKAIQRKNNRIRIIADSYQIEQIKLVKSLPEPYNNLFAYPYGRDMENEFSRMKRYGFLMFVRNSPTFVKRIKEVFQKTGISPSEVNFIYSQFKGYILKDHPAFKQSLYDFVYSYNWTFNPLHTSGHASKEALTRVVNMTKPSVAIIPIHKEKLGLFNQLDLDVNCPIVEKTCTIGEIEIQIG